ncbi:MAG TPA: heterodisulfide reductase-related iron-sulfur binding cluster [Streptosporangiaceae bacterium]|nr:heterodisulfide reductase-related iron-sulfur binding cluster [Streptosporangiaceae bacterium]
MTGYELDPDGELRKLAGDCVHCGFCLPACPTYQLWGEEMDSPRGRIHLITQILDGAAGTAAAATHLDRCLGCMACVPACPSGVQYDRLIEAAREWAEEPRAAQLPAAQLPAAHPPAAHPPAALPPRGRRDRVVRRAIFETFPYPARLRILMAPLRAVQAAGADHLIGRSQLAARLAPELVAALRIAPARPARQRRQASGRLPDRVPALGRRRAVVGMLTGCVQQVFFPAVNAATARVLAAEGCDVIVPPSQGCCGALSLHGGRRAEAAAFARRTIETFERAGVDAVVVNAAGCGSAMKDYGQLLAGDAAWAGRATALSGKVRDFSEFLAELGPAAPRHPLPLTAVYQDACHLGHAQRITDQPRELLRAIPDLRLAEVGDGGTCCGSAGIYNLVQPEAAAELGARKARAVHAASADPSADPSADLGADLLVSANPGCAMQIAAALGDQGTPMPVAHVAQVLDASLRGLSIYDVTMAVDRRRR